MENQIILEDEEDQNEYDYEFEVGPKLKFPTIQSAIDAAPPKTKIKIHKGIYKENIIIDNKGDIELCSETSSDPAIILSDNSPCIKIHKTQDSSTFKLCNLRLVHRGILNDISQKSEDDLIYSLKDAPPVSLSEERQQYYIYKQASLFEQLEVNYILDISLIDGIYEENKGDFAAISVLSGTLLIDNCQISLAFLTTETRRVLPGIFVDSATALIENVLIHGNKDFFTIGVLSHNGKIKINTSKIINHSCGGVLCELNETNSVSITKSEIIDNTGCGMIIFNKTKKSALLEKLCGLKGIVEVTIEGNSFEGNQGVGMKILNCFNLCLVGNKICGNSLNGADLTDCEGIVMLNEFLKNRGTGLLLETSAETFEAKIFQNIFNENYQNGIIVKGKNNFANISQNKKISNNYLSGIQVCDKASPKISRNSISTNMHHGIIIQSDSCAEIQDNKIFGNVKSNIAYGGSSAFSTKIIHNEIYSARCEGIFCIEASGGHIAGNKVYENNDGIVLVKCSGIELTENEVYKNIRIGVMISHMSTPKLKENKVFENKFIGVFIRDESKGVYENNIMKQNIIQLYLSSDCKKLLRVFKQENEMEGRYDVPGSCSIF